MMTIGAISGDTIQPGGLGVVVLHWMKESDVAMHAGSGLAVPAICGAWVEPNQLLAAQITNDRAPEVRYVSCTQCDLLADLRTDAMSA